MYLAAVRVLGDPRSPRTSTQEVFLALWRGCGYDESRGPLGPYLRLLARSRALDLWRRNRAGERTVARLQEHAVSDSATVEEPAHAAVLRAADRELARTQRAQPAAPSSAQAIGLTYWGGLTVQEAADHQGVPLGTAKSRVRLGLDKLARDPAMATA